jgi:Ca2+-binding RTX toxin-like protein
VALKVTDKNGGADSLSTYQTFTITVKDVVNGNHAPSTLRLNGATQVLINENALFNGTLSASDGDGDNTFTWSFDDSVAGNANRLFEIDNSGTGGKLLKLKAGIDYEALPAGQKYVTVYLKADDGKAGGTSATQAFTIAVADLDETPPNQAPTGVTLSGHMADEYAITGREVGTLSAYDANNDVLSYALLDDAGGRFMLSGNRILVADGFRLDFEQARSHTIAVQASDGRGGVTSQAFTIDVGNIDPEFTGGTARNDVFHGGVKNDVLLGNLGNDRLFGGVGNDTLKGEAGNDTLGGGAGLDKLYGTKGSASRDAFVFDTKLTSRSVAAKNKDTVVDFGPKYDSIFLDDAAFGNRTIAKYLKGKGAGLDHAYKMKSSFFRVGDKALDRDDFFIAKKVKPTEVKLYWDADGSGSKAMLEIGTVKLQKGEGTALTYKDFLFI